MKPNNKKPKSDKYSIGSVQTPIGPSAVSVHLLDVSGFDTSQRHMIGVKQYDAATIWVRDNDPEVQRLMKDHKAVMSAYHDRLNGYSESLREQRHGKRR